MKLISWNVNGLRAVITKGFQETYKNLDADIMCLQETKMQKEQITNDIEELFKDRNVYWNSAEKKGYSGTVVISKIKPINITYGIGKEKHDKEGRIITVEFNEFYLVNCYTPNSKRELERLDYRMEWEDEIRRYLEELKSKKSVILCGDLNVAHEEIDLKNPSTNHNSAGFTDKERNKMTELLNSGFIDTFRYLYPDKKDIYSWWSYMFHAREKNAGWRIDYFIVSDDLKDKIKDAKIHTEIMGSDHCPVELDINLN